MITPDLTHLTQNPTKPSPMIENLKTNNYFFHTYKIPPDLPIDDLDNHSKLESPKKPKQIINSHLFTLHFL